MDETTRRIIESITVNYPQPTRTPSGHQVTVFFDCARLTESDLARLGAEATGHLLADTFDVVVGVAYSGVFFANAVAHGKHMGVVQKDGELFGFPVKGKRVVLVDDVICTGKHLLAAAKKVEEQQGRVVGFACIVDRLLPPGELDKKPVWSAFQDGMK